MTDSRRGLLYAFAGIMVLSFDSLLVRLIGGTEWNLLFWRGGLQASSLLLILLLFNRQELIQNLAPPRLPVLLPAIAFATTTIFFIESLARTQVASTLVILNTAPLFTAILALILLKEKIHKSTLLAIAASISGIWLIFAFAPAKGELVGNLYAVVAAISTAFYLVFLRKTEGKHVSSILIVAGLIVASYSLYRGADPLSISGHQFLLLAVLGGGVVPLAYFFIGRSAGYIPAGQTSFILLAEVLLGPLYVFLFIGEVPSTNDMAGGAIILTTLGLYTFWQIRQSGD